MPARKNPATANATPTAPTVPAYVLRIELRDLKPAIWREVWVDPGITLRRLHAVIQAMGWEDCHLHGFAIPGTGRAAHYWGVPAGLRFEPKAAREDDGWGEPSNDDAREPLTHVLRQPKDKLLYLYDFGDDWEHLITLRGSIASAETLPHLAAGQHRCPPEDCGGVPGFADLMQAWHDSADPGHAEVRAWLQEIGHEGEPGVLDEAGWARLQQAVARLWRRPPKPRKVRTVTGGE
jgi:hypothetical protein